VSPAGAAGTRWRLFGQAALTQRGETVSSGPAGAATSWRSCASGSGTATLFACAEVQGTLCARCRRFRRRTRVWPTIAKASTRWRPLRRRKRQSHVVADARRAERKAHVMLVPIDIPRPPAHGDAHISRATPAHGAVILASIALADARRSGKTDEAGGVGIRHLASARPYWPRSSHGLVARLGSRRCLLLTDFAKPGPDQAALPDKMPEFGRAEPFAKRQLHRFEQVMPLCGTGLERVTVDP